MAEALKSTTFGTIAASEGGTGTPALFLHGGLLNRSLFNDLLDGLRGERRCVAIDLPGFGESPALEKAELSLELLSGAVEPVLREVGVEHPVDLVGLSLGGGIAIELARTCPEFVRSACLIGIGGKAGKKQPAADSDPAPPPPSEAGDFASQFANRMLGPDATVEMRRSVIEAAAATPSASRTALLDLLHSYPDVAARARTLELPILALCGSEDAMVRLEDLESQFAGSSNIKVCSIDGVGHLVPLEDPHQLAENLRAFWADCER